MDAQTTRDWQQEIHHAIITALPNPTYELITFKQAKSTESIYANVFYHHGLFYLRFSWHENERSRRFNDASFDLRRFLSQRELIHTLRQHFLKPAVGYLALNYRHFIWLALLEKLGQADQNPLRLTDTGALIKDNCLNNHRALSYLDELLDYGLALAVHENSYLALSEAGLNILNRYWDIAEFFADEQWDANPRIMTVNELTNLLTIL